MEESLCGGKIVWSKVKRAASAVQWMEELSCSLAQLRADPLPVNTCDTKFYLLHHFGILLSTNVRYSE